MAFSKNTHKFLIGFFLLIISFNCKSETEIASAISSTSVAGTLTVSADGVFMRNGKAYQGIGVNYFNAFYRTILNTSDTTYSAGFKYLSNNKIPFVRFSATGFWPNELSLYQTNKALYFSALDKFVKCAERNGVGLIPSLFWFYATVPDLMGEHMNQWANPNSKTIAFMRTYTAEVVSRYKDSPAIWGWEIGNEFNSYCDLLDQAINFLPKVNIAGGTPATRTIEDAFTTNILRAALTEFTTTVRMYDPNRPIFSGNAMPAANMYHRYKYANWTQDSSADFTSLLDVQNPSGLKSLTIHLYPDQVINHFSNKIADINIVIQEAMRSANELKRPFFLGEFGSPKTLGTVIEAQKFQEILSAVIDNKVQLSALWVYDFSSQDADWNITQTNSRKYQLDAIINANAQFLLSAGINETKDINLSCSVYPNPTSDIVQLKVGASSMINSQSMSYQLYDMQGRLLETKKIVAELTNIAVNNLVPSIYFVKIIQENQEVKVFKIIKD